MTHEFSTVGFLVKGYHQDQVDEFLERAKNAYESQGQRGDVSSWDVRTVGFDVRRLGPRYNTDEVDAALVRIEDAFASRERRQLEQARGSVQWQAHIRAQEQALRAQLVRGDGQRFPRGSGLELTYDCDQVDDLCDALDDGFTSGQLLTPDQVRTSVFASRRGGRGYQEEPVDAFLDQMVELLVAMSTSTAQRQ